MNEHLLIVEDDAALSEALAMHFEGLELRVSRARTLADTLALLDDDMPDLVLLDQQLPDGTGLELLTPLRTREPELPVIMMTGLHDLELAIAAIQRGAYDFIHKPIQVPALENAVTRALEHQRLVRRLRALDSPAEAEDAKLREMLGHSAAMLALSKEIALVARSDVRVLITGESGTGKEVVARAIHAHSHREGPFLAVNCAAIVDNLLESELFGHERGAFTGAVQRKPGKFELATDGTLFLDEIGELELSLQAKLLRVLQEHSFERVGGTQQLHTQARVIAATNRDLDQAVANGEFREDLLYRLKVIHLHIPPLRQRQDDIPLLAEGLMSRIARDLHREPLHITEAAMAMLGDYHWPGNIRELENVLTQALVRARDRVLSPELLTFEAAPPPPSVDPQSDPFRDPEGRWLTLEELEAQHTQRILDDTGGHKGQCCEILGISRPALERKIQKYGLQVPQGRQGH